MPNNRPSDRDSFLSNIAFAKASINQAMTRVSDHSAVEALASALNALSDLPMLQATKIRPSLRGQTAKVLRLVPEPVNDPSSLASLELLQKERARVLSGDIKGVMVVALDNDGSYSCNSADALYDNDKVHMTLAQWLMGLVVSKGMYPSKGQG